MRVYLAVAAAALAACGDEPQGPLIDRLRALPGVHDVEKRTTQNEGYEYYVLHFEQPVDHANPGGPTFLQEVSLLHRNEDAPLVVWTSGYWDYYHDYDVELTQVLVGNQISIEHRYFAESRPEPADWSKLTIEQMAADEHAIITAFRDVYEGAFITSGASKGGMTAIYHRRFYPDDVEGTVPYVAPISFAAPDTRYNAFFDTVGSATCRQAVRDVAIEMLSKRRAALVAKAQEQAAAENVSYTRIQIGPAVEGSIVSLEWAFWQYYGASWCNRVPATNASDDQMWAFLDRISPPSDNGDDRVGQFDAYYYQAYFQLGYPDAGASYLDPYVMYSDADYANSLPTAMPAYDGGAAMQDIDTWVKTKGNRLLFIYGEWDPWTAGKFDLGNATESAQFVVAQGTHGANLSSLAPADRDTAFALLADWTGVTPMLPARTRALVPPTLPPSLRVPPR
jgi:hypothetical protein